MFIYKMRIDPEKIGLVIGPNAKTLRGIEEQSGATVEIDDDGYVNLVSNDGDAVERARRMIEAITGDLQGREGS